MRLGCATRQALTAGVQQQLVDTIMALFVPQWSPELVGDVIIAQNVCSNLYRVVVASFVVMLVLPLAYLLSDSFGAFSGAILGCFALLDFFDWVCSCAAATRRLISRPRGGHASA